MFVSYYDDNYHVNGVRVNADPDEAAMYGGTLTWFVHEYFSIELSCDYVKTDVDLSSLGLSGDAGELTQVPVLLTLRSHFSTNTRVSPYLGGGGGYYFNDFDSKSAGVAPVYGVGADIDVEDNYGLHVCAGVEFRLTDTLVLDLNLRYVWTEVEVEVDGFSDEEFRADAFVGGLGLKLYF
jgi:outer membrane protein W